MARRFAMGIAAGVMVAGAVGALGRTSARGDEPQATVAAIDAEFEKEALKLEKTRLDRLAKLAATKTGAEASRVYEAFFRAAIANNLYAEAEATALAALKADVLSPQATLLADLVNLIAQADRGAYEESLKNLDAMIATQAQEPKALPVSMKLSLIDAYYQKLVRSGQFEVARKALTSLQAKAIDPAIKDLVERRLVQVNLVGKPAPAIDGTDIDGKPYHLADAKGDAVLVIFWATWCLPNAQEVAMFDAAYTKYRDKGLRVVGINVDAFQDGGRSAEAVAPDVKRFLLERNVRWPNLIEHPGERDLAKAFGVSDIPSNVLIGRDGKILRIDLTGAILDEAIAKAVAK